MDMTCSSFISILAPGTRLLPILQNRVPNPHKDSAQAPLSSATSSPKSSYPNTLPFQPLQQGVPSRVPRTSFGGLPLPRLGLCPPHQLFPSLPVPGVRSSPSGGGSSSLTTSKFGLVSPVLRRCLSVVAPAPLPRPAPLHLVPSSFPKASPSGRFRSARGNPFPLRGIPTSGSSSPFSITRSAHDQMTSAAAAASSKPLLGRRVPGLSPPSASASRPLRRGARGACTPMPRSPAPLHP